MTSSAPPTTAAPHLLRALQASQNGQPDAAIEALLAHLRDHPGHAQAHYLLGAELAQCERYGDAVVRMALALELEPALDTARLQLGLLWLTLQLPGRCAQEVAPLRALPPSDALRHFADGLDALARNDLPHAHACLSAGLQCPNDNVSLRSDMLRLLQATHDNLGAVAPHAQSVDADPLLADRVISNYARGH